jgi:hypothetical protein
VVVKKGKVRKKNQSEKCSFERQITLQNNFFCGRDESGLPGLSTPPDHHEVSPKPLDPV